MTYYKVLRRIDGILQSAYSEEREGGLIYSEDKPTKGINGPIFIFEGPVDATTFAEQLGGRNCEVEIWKVEAEKPRPVPFMLDPSRLSPDVIKMFWKMMVNRGKTHAHFFHKITYYQPPGTLVADKITLLEKLER